jgi:tetratricopeptide (TPR) repeat protein
MHYIRRQAGFPGAPVSAIRKASFALVAASIISAGCGATPEAYLQRGNRFFDAGKYDDADIQYRKAIQKQPTFGEAHYRLALVELKKDKSFDALEDLRAAVQFSPDNESAIAKLGELSIFFYNADSAHSTQFYREAVQAKDQLVARNVGGFDALRLQGALAMIDRKPHEAVEYLRKANAVKPGDLETALGLARALAADHQTQAALDFAQGLIRKYKTFGKTYDFLYEQYRAAGKRDDAENILKLKVANNPGQADFILELARYYAAASKPAEMQATLQRMLDRSADFPDSRMRVGDFYSSLGKLDQAARLYQEGLAASPKNPVSWRKRLIPLLAAQRKFPEALQQVDTLLKARPDDPESKLVRAQIWLEEGKPENLDPAIVELRAQIHLKPREPVLHYQLGLALSRKDDRVGTLREWTAAAGMNRSYLPPRFALASLELSQGRPQEALQKSEEILAVEPANPAARLLNAVCLTSAGRFSEARNKLNRLISDFPQSPNARYQLGVLAISERKYGEAEDIFRELQKNVAGNPKVIAGLVDAYRGQNQSGRAMQLLQDELKRSSNAQPLRGLLARFAADWGNPDLAIEQYRQMLLADPKSVDIRLAMGQAYETKGDYASAVPVFEKAAQTDAKSEMASLKLAGALGEAGRTNEAKASYRRALALQPDDPRAMNSLAFLMLETGESVDDAMKLAQRGLRFADDPRMKNSLEDTLGWAYLKKRMYDAALQTFQSIVKADPSNATFHYHLGTALYEKGDKRQARIELESALAAKPVPGDEPKIRELLTHL